MLDPVVKPRDDKGT
ncbi:MAG: hypothetical protein ACEY3D_03910 [Rickettsia sp.]